MKESSPDDRDRPSPDRNLPPEPPIHRAARKGDLAELQRLLDAGADINERADLEYDHGPHLCDLTPLMVAARSIDGATTRTLHWLIEHGADLLAQSAGGNSAAWYAAGHGGRLPFHKKAVTPDHLDRLRYLLDNGLSAKECNRAGRSLLTEAARAGDAARVALLLERGANATPWNPVTEGRDEDQGSLGVAGMFGVDDGDMTSAPLGKRYSFQIPLFCASESGSTECVRLLLKAGADPNERDDSGQTPLMAAGSGEVVELLIRSGADLDAKDEFGHDALQNRLEDECSAEGCGKERVAVLDALLAAGADIEQADTNGKTRLISAAFGQHDGAVEYLLARGANPHAVDQDGGTALHAICWQGGRDDPEESHACERIIDALIRAGIDPNVTDRQGGTPMHEAASGDWGNPAAIRALLRHGAAPDPADDHGNTPLLLAADRGEAECVRLLLEAGADPTRRNQAGESPMDAARSHLATCEEIAAEGPDILEAEMREINEAVTRAMTEMMGDEFTLPDVLTNEGISAQQQQSLLDAREALMLIERAAQGRR